MESRILQSARSERIVTKKMAFLFIKIQIQINKQQLQWGLWNFVFMRKQKFYKYWDWLFPTYIPFFFRRVITFASPAIKLCIYAAAFIQRSPSTLLTLAGWSLTELSQRNEELLFPVYKLRNVCRRRPRNSVKRHRLGMWQCCGRV